MQFDGENYYVEILNAPLFNAQVFTLAAWLYSENGNTTCAYFQRVGSWHITTYQNEWRFVVETRTPRFEIPSGYFFPSPDPQWHHYAVVVDNPNELVTFFVDGVQIGNPQPYPEDTVPFGDSPSNVLIGQYGYSAEYRWDGGVDDVRFYNRALSEAAIYQLYLMGK
jgi:hypothetical protein